MSIELHRRRGGKIWQMEGTELGILVRRSTKTTDYEQAKIILQKTRAELFDNHTYGAQATTTFGVAATGYMKAGFGGRDKRFLDRLLFDDKRAPTAFSETKLREIKNKTLRDLAAQLMPGCEGSSIDRAIYTPVIAVMRWAAHDELCEAPMFTRPKTGKGRTDWLRPLEAERFLAACAPHHVPLMLLLIGTGCRISEGLFIDWHEIDLDGGYAEIIGTTDDDDTEYGTKTGERRTVSLSPRVVAALRALPHRDGAVFRRHDGEPYSPGHSGNKTINKTFKAVARRAGLGRVNPHMTRHTFATWQCQMGTPLLRVMALGGWKSYDNVHRYSHMQDRISPADAAIIASWLVVDAPHRIEPAAPMLRVVS